MKCSRKYLMNIFVFALVYMLMVIDNQAHNTCVRFSVHEQYSGPCERKSGDKLQTSC